MYNMNVGSNQRWSAPSTMTSWHHFHSTVTQNSQNLTQLQLCSNSVRVHVYAYPPHWKVLKHFLDVDNGCGDQSQVIYSLNHDIMASCPLDSHPELPKSDPASVVWQCKGALKCLGISLKCAKTLYICPMWMQDAIKGGNQPQPWHHGIISTWQSSRIAKIWPSFSGVTM